MGFRDCETSIPVRSFGPPQPPSAPPPRSVLSSSHSLLPHSYRASALEIGGKTGGLQSAAAPEVSTHMALAGAKLPAYSRYDTIISHVLGYLFRRKRPMGDGLGHMSTSQ